MNILIKGTHVDLTPSLKQYVEDKIGNLGKFIVAQEAQVELARDQHHRTGPVFRAEANLIMGGKLLRAEASSEDIYASIDMLVPKLKEQISKFKDKKTTIRRSSERKARGKI